MLEDLIVVVVVVVAGGAVVEVVVVVVAVVVVAVTVVVIVGVLVVGVGGTGERSVGKEVDLAAWGLGGMEVVSGKGRQMRSTLALPS